MTESDDYFEWPIYGLPAAEKRARLATALTQLTWHHASACPAYGRILTAHGYRGDEYFDLERVPFIPVQLFKTHTLQSIASDQVFKVLRSSGTTSQQTSRIVLDRRTSMAQSRALVVILQQFLGKARRPMLIIDHPGVIKDRNSFSARGAGILGLSSFGRDHTYALKDESMAPDLDTINAFLARNGGKDLLLFGFTFMVWKHFFQSLQRQRVSLTLPNATLLHSGGWKKLLDESVDNATFKNALGERLGINRIHNFYGMVEQVGSIFMECEHGRLHAPAFSDVLIRDPHDWSLLPPGKEGVIQVVSVLPTSYPGHSLVTEDTGWLIGEDDCPCGRLGRTFHVKGRLARAELRGCSDTHAVDQEGKSLR